MTTALGGCGTAIVTPFTRDGAVDVEALRKLVDWQIEEGIDFLVPCGSTGEAQTLTVEERVLVAGTVVEAAAGRVPVMAGASHNDTRQAVDEARRMSGLGVTWLLSATPWYNKPTPEGLFRHFSAVADAATVPVCLYNIPGRSGVNLRPDTVLRLAAHPNIIGIKESSGDLAQVQHLLLGRPEGFAVLSGEDWMTLAIIAAGGDGLISVASNEIPRLMARLVDSARAGTAGGRPRDPLPRPAAARGQLPGDQPGAGEGGARRDGPDRERAPAAAGAAVGVPAGAAAGRAAGGGDRARRPGGTMIAELKRTIERFVAAVPAGAEAEARNAFQHFKTALNAGAIRAAIRAPDGTWVAQPWVKAGILLGFRLGIVAPMAVGSPFPFFDKDTWPLRPMGLGDGVRIVPGGSSIRDGCYVAAGVVLMPPAFINVGAYVDTGTMVDSHALVGSCAQIGKRVHLSAGAQIGGVLEPVGALPVIVEDEVLVGGNCGVYEGTIVRTGAVLAPGTLLTGGTIVFDLVRNTRYRREGDRPLEIPAGAVVVPGARPVTSGAGRELGISLYAPVVVKYRDDQTDTAVQLEALLR